ncbi:uncharacterized protein YtpQ (UPF0354 family) [Burkholderia sp. OAS925]|uniref:DUF1444 family protein n=1 Tax=Paraburkholderia TaxID=1822464 RepID=UPI00178A813C|nr:DUF1444 family protein [Paraburkholderia graminis]MDR6472151.1 uncharacterized protein YtpQ (UPF0354 family) [Paraburkholderia graminis]
MRFFDRFRKPTPQKFAELFMSSLRSSGDTRAWEYDSNLNRLVPDETDGAAPVHFINLHNLFREYAEAKPAERTDILRRQTNGMREQTIPSIFEEARERLRPVVRSSTERGVTYLQTRGTGSRFDIAFRPLCENLEIGIAYDGESTIMRLTEHKLSEWNVTFDEAYDIAIDNLRLASSKPFATLQNGVHLSQFGDHYDASRLLLTDVLHRQPISGAPVVMAPNRTVLLLTGDRNTVGLQTMMEIAEEALGQPRALPALMLRWDGAVWQKFVPDGLEAKLRQLRTREIAGDYHDQQAHLNDIHGREGVDIFVPQYTVAERPSGELFTACVWTDSVHSLLPATDIVVLVRLEPKQMAFVPWRELVKECAHLMKRTELLPVRYEVDGFPEEQLFQEWCIRFNKVKELVQAQ